MAESRAARATDLFRPVKSAFDHLVFIFPSWSSVDKVVSLGTLAADVHAGRTQVQRLGPGASSHDSVNIGETDSEPISCGVSQYMGVIVGDGRGQSTSRG